MTRDQFSDQITIKLNPELRHALSHLWLAIHELASGNVRTCFAELRSIESLVLFDEGEEERIYRKGVRRPCRRSRRSASASGNRRRSSRGARSR